MKYFILFFTLFLCNLSFSQNFYLKIKGKNELETKQIDSLNYKSQHNLVADILKEKGYPIARRTIAKYREQLDIPVARMRKKI